MVSYVLETDGLTTYVEKNNGIDSRRWYLKRDRHIETCEDKERENVCVCVWVGDIRTV